MSVLPFLQAVSPVTLLLWGAAVFFIVLAVRSALRSRSPRKWRDREAIEWGQSRQV
jgi:hypothetical protein